MTVVICQYGELKNAPTIRNIRCSAVEPKYFDCYIALHLLQVSLLRELNFA